MQARVQMEKELFTARAEKNGIALYLQLIVLSRIKTCCHSLT
jgi:hypothetical protein